MSDASSLEVFRGQIGWGLEQPDLVEGIRPWEGLQLGEL